MFRSAREFESHRQNAENIFFIVLCQKEKAADAAFSFCTFIETYQKFRIVNSQSKFQSGEKAEFKVGNWGN